MLFFRSLKHVHANIGPFHVPTSRTPTLAPHGLVTALLWLWAIPQSEGKSIIMFQWLPQGTTRKSTDFQFPAILGHILRISIPIGSVCMPYMVCHLPSIYPSHVSACVSHTFDRAPWNGLGLIMTGWWLFATPLKNMVRQLGWWHSLHIWEQK